MDGGGGGGSAGGVAGQQQQSHTLDKDKIFSLVLELSTMEQREQALLVLVRSELHNPSPLSSIVKCEVLSPFT